ncbi:hypothetical protein GCM10022631_26450 [Deinococcus rubellus]
MLFRPNQTPRVKLGNANPLAHLADQPVPHNWARVKPTRKPIPVIGMFDPVPSAAQDAETEFVLIHEGHRVICVAQHWEKTHP